MGIKKKIVFITVDGMGDDPHGNLFSGSDIPNLDYMVSHGRIGRIYTVRGKPPESDIATVRLFGYEFSGARYEGRGPLEALGAGVIRLGESGYCAWRANFASLRTARSVFGTEVLDSHVGRALTRRHAQSLCYAINKACDEGGIPARIHPTVEHRAVVVMRGQELSGDVSNLDPFYVRMRDGTTRAHRPRIPLMPRCRPFTDRRQAVHTAQIANRFIETAYSTLKKHQIQERSDFRLKTANGLLMRNAGTEVVPLHTALRMRWAAHVGMPLERGIARAGKMRLTTFNYDDMSLDTVRESVASHDAVFRSFYLTMLRTEMSEYGRYLRSVDRMDADAVWFHIKPLDSAGHAGRLDWKRELLEHLDRGLFAELRMMVDRGQICLVLTADHCTECALMRHTHHPVPLLIAGHGRDDAKAFTESAYMRSKLELDAPSLFSRDGPLKDIISR